MVNKTKIYLMKALKTMNKRLLILGLILSTSSIALQAQQDETDPPMDMDVTFVGDLELFIRDANKINGVPKTRESMDELPPIGYSLIPNKMNAEIEVLPITAAKVNVEEKLKKLYRGFVKGGFGLYTTPLLEVYYTDGRSRKGTYGIEAKHISTAGGVAVDDSIPDGFSHNSIHLWGKKFLDKHALTGGFTYDRQVVNYYGFSPDSFPLVDTDNIKQRFNLVEIEGGLVSYHRDSTKLNYDVGLKFYNYGDIKDGSENNIDVAGLFRKKMNNEIYKLNVGLNYNNFSFNSLKDSTKTTRDNAILRIEPMAYTTRGNLQVSLGMSLMLDGTGDQPVHFYPLAEASYGLFGNILVPYAGVRGAVVRQSYRDLTETNPFILTAPQLKSMNNKLELYGGIRGRISSEASFNAHISSNSFEDFAYFVNDTVYSATNQFQVVYDKLNVVNIGGEISLQGNEKLSLYVRGDYFIYGDKGPAEAWHQPTSRFSFGGVYDIQDKLIFRAEIYQMGKRKALSLGPVKDGKLQSDGTYITELKGYFDANIEAEYRYTKRLSAFVRVNNFMASRYSIWNNYNLQRFNSMMGASFAF